MQGNDVILYESAVNNSRQEKVLSLDKQTTNEL